MLSPLQYVAGKDRTIHHGIARARDAIFAAEKARLRCGIGDQDYVTAFDFLVLSWVWKVLLKFIMIKSAWLLLSKIFMMPLTRTERWVSLDLYLRKPCCTSESILNLSKCSIIVNSHDSA